MSTSNVINLDKCYNRNKKILINEKNNKKAEFQDENFNKSHKREKKDLLIKLKSLDLDFNDDFFKLIRPNLHYSKNDYLIERLFKMKEQSMHIREKYVL